MERLGMDSKIRSRHTSVISKHPSSIHYPYSVTSVTLDRPSSMLASVCTFVISNFHRNTPNAETSHLSLGQRAGETGAAAVGLLDSVDFAGRACPWRRQSAP